MSVISLTDRAARYLLALCQSLREGVGMALEVPRAHIPEQIMLASGSSSSAVYSQSSQAQPELKIASTTIGKVSLLGFRRKPFLQFVSFSFWLDCPNLF